MSFPISAALLDAIVLSVVAQEPEGRCLPEWRKTVL